MINRRNILAGAAVLAFTATTATAQDWKTKYPELTFAVVPAENASGVTERWTPFVAYLSKELGVKVTLRIANDYAAVIEGQRAGNIHIASYGSASFARARLTGVKTDAFAKYQLRWQHRLLLDVLREGDELLQGHRRVEGQKSRSRRPELDFGQQRSALRARQDGHFGR
jgi:ABC-type phosphate/phosphonate transport system substrate-binding protein